MEKVRPWCGQPSDRGRLTNRTEQYATSYGLSSPLSRFYCKLRCRSRGTTVNAVLIAAITAVFVVMFNPITAVLPPLPQYYRHPRPHAALYGMVCRSICHGREPCENGSTDRNAVWFVDPVAQGSMYSTGVKIPHAKGQFVAERGRLIVKWGLSVVNCAKTAQSIETPLGIWTRVGPRKHY